MTRTKRNTKVISEWGFRNPQTKNYLTAEYYAWQELKESGFDKHNRLQAKAGKGGIVTAWDDIHIAALSENYQVD